MKNKSQLEYSSDNEIAEETQDIEIVNNEANKPVAEIKTIQEVKPKRERTEKQKEATLKMREVLKAKRRQRQLQSIREEAEEDAKIQKEELKDQEIDDLLIQKLRSFIDVDDDTAKNVLQKAQPKINSGVEQELPKSKPKPRRKPQRQYFDESDEELPKPKPKTKSQPEPKGPIVTKQYIPSGFKVSFV